MRIPKVPCKIEVYAAVNPSEDPEKVRLAVSHVINTSDFQYKEGSIKATSTDVESLLKIQEIIKKYRTSRVYRRQMRYNTKGDTTWFYLNKQAAFVDVIAICEEAEESAMGPIKVLLADDSPEFLKMASKFLAADPEVDLVGVALTGQDALVLTAGLQPDLILMDLIMPEMNGLDATRQIKSMPNAPIVVMLTGHDTPEYRSAAASAGADGFVYKPELFKELLPLMHRLTTVVTDKQP